MSSVKVCLRDMEHYAKGGSVGKAKQVAGKGRYGDSMIVHLNPDEYHELVQAWGQPTINPDTGMPEFFLSGLKKWLSKNSWVAPVASTLGAVALGPLAGSAIGSLAPSLSSGASSLLGNALVGGGIGALTGGGLKGAIPGALLGGLAAPYLNNALVGTGLGNTFGLANEPTITSYLGSLFGANGSGYATSGALAGGNPAGYDPTTGKVVPVTSANNATEASGSGSILGSLFGGGLGGSGGLLSGGLGSLVVPAALGLMGWYGYKQYKKAADAQKAQQNAFGNGYGAGAGGGGDGGGGGGGGGESLAPADFNRENLSSTYSPQDYYTYGQNPGKQFFTENHLAAGGRVHPQSATTVTHTSHTSPMDGRADTVPAMLSHGEYVMDAETVSMLGNGNNEAGAQKLDQMRDNLRKHKGKALAKGKISPDALPPLEYLRGAA